MVKSREEIEGWYQAWATRAGYPQSVIEATMPAVVDELDSYQGDTGWIWTDGVVLSDILHEVLVNYPLKASAL